jgi:hypothetical protein
MLFAPEVVPVFSAKPVMLVRLRRDCNTTELIGREMPCGKVLASKVLHNLILG